MSIPKIKAYRLDRNYSEENDDDIRSLSNDELLPIKKKQITLEAPEPMVGVRLRGDARMVYRGSSLEEAIIPLMPSLGSTGEKVTMPWICDGWVLGKGNLKLLIYNEDWTELRPFAWDYEISQKKLYRHVWKSSDDRSSLPADCWINGVPKKFFEASSIAEGGIVETEKASDLDEFGVDEIHMVDFVVFKIGEMARCLLGSSDEEGKGILDGIVPGAEVSSLDDEKAHCVRIAYIPYKEMCWKGTGVDLNIIRTEGQTPLGASLGLTSSGQTSPSSNCGVAFGDVYNGEINGRSIRHFDDNGLTVDGDASQSDGRCTHYYEGNYMFARNVFPMRVRRANVSDGSCVFDNVPVNIYADGPMKPVLMEKMMASGTGEKIFKPVAESQVSMSLSFVYPQDGETTMKYGCSCVEAFYGTESEPQPKELYLMFNFHEDGLGTLLDFNYDYDNYVTPSLPSIELDVENNRPVYHRFNELAYNTGALSVGSGNASRFDQDFEKVWLRKEVIAVENGHGLIEEDTRPKTMAELIIDPGTMRASAKIDSGCTNVCVYVGGEKVEGTKVAYGNDGTVTVSDWNNEKHDMLIVFYAGEDIADLSDSDTLISNEVEGTILGYRVPCYEKVRTSDLFVSSYPNWLKGHLNNDLDVFYGFKDYQGVTLDDQSVGEVSVSAIGGWFPCYQQDGWHPMYPEGAVQFSEELTQTDYLDILNFSLQENSDILGDKTFPECVKWIGGPDRISLEGAKALRKYHRKVMCNVAHYDGIYSVVRGRMSNYTLEGGAKYRLIDYEQNGEAVGKRWTIGDNETLRRMFEAGNVMMPQLMANTDGGLEMLSPVSSVKVAGGTRLAETKILNGDRGIYFLVSGGTLSEPSTISVKIGDSDSTNDIMMKYDLASAKINVSFDEGEIWKELTLGQDFIEEADGDFDFRPVGALKVVYNYELHVDPVGVYYSASNEVASYEVVVYRTEVAN